MKTYRYSVRLQDGNVEHGTIEANSLMDSADKIAILYPNYQGFKIRGPLLD